MGTNFLMPFWFDSLPHFREHTASTAAIQHVLPVLPPLVVPEKRPRRTFDPRFSRRYGYPTLEPRQLVRYSPKYGYSRLFNFPYRGSGWRPRMNTIVLQIHGIADSAQAAGGVYFGREDRDSRFTLGVLHRQTHQTAILVALYQALQRLIAMRHVTLDDRWREAIIMTNNTYVIQSFNKWVWQWEVNGWQHIRRGGQIQHMEIIREIQNLLTHLENDLNMAVRFWKVDKKDIPGARKCANVALDHVRNSRTGV